MELSNLSPFSAGTLTWQPSPRERRMTVCLKATFALVHGEEASLAARQEPVHDAVYRDGDPRRGLYAPSDFVPFKPRADVALVGTAYAPGGAPVESLVVRLRVGNLLEKALRVTGERAWEQGPGGLAPGRPRPFTQMPIHYERAARRGDNVAGLPIMGGAGQALPSVDVVEEAGGAGTPGFGPIATAWRAQREGMPESTLLWADELRIARRAGPMPPGLDASIFNAAPRDQQVPELSRAISLGLEHLHPHIPRFEARLPEVYPKVFYMDPASGWPAEADVRADTLWIDADRLLAVVSWRGIVDLGGADERREGKLFVAAEAAGEPVTYEDVARLARDRAARGNASISARSMADRQVQEVGGSTAYASGAPQGNPLPFRAGPASPEVSSPSGVRPARGAPGEGAPRAAPAAPGDLGDRTIALGDSTIKLSGPSGPARSPLPFRGAGSTGAVGDPQAGNRVSSPPPSGPAKPARPSSVITAPLPGDAAPVAAVPFAPAPVAAPMPVAPAPVAAPMPVARAPVAPVVAAPAIVAPIAPAPASPPTVVEPPPMIGPLGSSDRASALPAPPASTQAPAPLPARSPADFSIEECAAVTAQIDQASRPLAEILEASSLSAEDWLAIKKHWTKALRAETQRGKTALLKRYDAAYVAALERDRGPIQVEEYARLAVAAEQGSADEALEELKLPAPGLIRVQRVWMRKLVEDPELGAKARRAMERAREA